MTNYLVVDNCSPDGINSMRQIESHIRGSCRDSDQDFRNFIASLLRDNPNISIFDKLSTKLCFNTGIAANAAENMLSLKAFNIRSGRCVIFNHLKFNQDTNNPDRIG